MGAWGGISKDEEGDLIEKMIPNLVQVHYLEQVTFINNKQANVYTQPFMNILFLGGGGLNFLVAYHFLSAIPTMYYYDLQYPIQCHTLETFLTLCSSSCL